MSKMNTVLLGSGDRVPELMAVVDRLRPVIQQRFDIIGEDLDYSSDLRHLQPDFGIVFGGDGSILRSAKWMGVQQFPILGVNLGKLGFLAVVKPEQLPVALDSILHGKHRLVEHLMMRCQVIRDGEILVDEIGLNEVAIFGGPPFEIQTIDLYVDGELATSYRCDGLIISTPVGSTAHNLSAGGPIMRKDLDAFVISPISPHTLTVRPVVDRSQRLYEIVVSQPNASTSVVLDGQVLARLTASDRVRISRAEPVFRLIETPGHSYYANLREKLGWGGHFSNTSKR